MIVDNASGFSNGFDAGYGNHWHTYLGPTATARILYGDLANKTLAAPVFSGTIPTIEGNEGDADIVTDLSTYFSGATSYSIDPAVEAGWTFDTGTGILTVTTGTVNTFGPYTVTGTNATGSDSSNAFSVTISDVVEVEEENTGGFWFRYEQEMYRRADERKKAERLKKEADKKKKELAKELEEAELRLIEEIEAEERKVEKEKTRIAELSMLTKLVSEEKDYIEKNLNDNVIMAANRAIIQGNYSAMESLERQLMMAREEELFLMQATEILLNQ